MSEQSNTNDKYRWYVLSILVLAYTFSFIDRQIMSLLVEPLKRDLEISDTEVSLLIGLSFALFYTIAGLPFGRLVDKYNRTKIITVGIVCWSLMTAICGLTKDFWQVFLARMGVGVGEATLSPASYSLIADYFPPQKMGLAFGIYSIGVYVGGGIAMILGGLVVQTFDALPDVTLPFVGTIYSWQLVFFVVGLPGLVVAALVYAIREPARKGELKSNELKKSIPIKEILKFVRAQRRTFFFHHMGFAVSTMAGYSLSAWAPSFFIRTYGWSIQDAGLYFGGVVLVSGVVGVLLGGYLSDQAVSRGAKDGRIRIAAWGGALGLIPTVLFPLVDSAWLSVVLVGLSIFFITFGSSTGPASLQEVVPNRMRGQLSAFFLFVVSILGLAVGPTVVALITDYVFTEPSDVRYSLSIFCGASMFISAAFCVLTLKPYRKSRDSYLDSVIQK